MSEVTDGHLLVVCVMRRENVVVLRAPYKGEILEIIYNPSHRVVADYEITDLSIVPELYSTWTPRASSIDIPEAMTYARSAISLFEELSSS